MNFWLKHLHSLIGKAFADVPDFSEKVRVEFEKLENAKSFWSEVYVAKLESDLEEVPKEVFIKIPRMTENVNRAENIDNEDLMATLRYYAKRESDFYKLLNNREIPHFPTPHIYHIEEIVGDGTGGMVAESLVGQVHAIDYLPGLNDEQVLRLMEAFAGFHSFSMKMSKENDFSLFPEGELFHEKYQEMTYTESLLLETYGSSRFGNSRIQNIAWSFDYDNKTKTIAKCIEKCPGILTHGDLNVTNMLWNNSEPNALRAVIDFQMIHVNSPAFDIVRVLTLGISRKQRKANTERYLKHYYSTLEKLSESGNAPFSFDELKEQYITIFPIASNFTLFGIGIYYKMYSDGSLGKEEMKEENLEELLDRAEGIVEDIENSIV